jgi:hypothetical protein
MCKNMIVFLLITLAGLWFLNYIGLPFIALGTILFTLFGVSVTLYQLLVFLIIVGFVGLLPGVVRLIALFLLFLWVLSIFGLISVLSLPDIIVFAAIFGVIYYLIVGSP